MGSREKMTELHWQSDELLDSHESKWLSEKDTDWVVNKFLKLHLSSQLDAIRWGIREVHRGQGFSEKEIDKTSKQILFKIQCRPYDATSFGMGTPVGVK